MVSADRRDAQPGAGRLVHLAEHQRGLLDDAGLPHLDDEAVALTGALPDPGEHRDATEVLRDPVDHLLDQHRLADAGAAEQADLAARDVGVSRSTTLMPVSNISRLGLELVERRWVAMDRPALGDVQ